MNLFYTFIKFIFNSLAYFMLEVELVAHFWTSTKMSVDLEYCTLLDQYKNESWLREWYTFGPVRTWVLTSRMAHFWTSQKMCDDKGMDHFWTSTEMRLDSGMVHFWTSPKMSVDSGMAHFWTSVVDCTTSFVKTEILIFHENNFLLDIFFAKITAVIVFLITLKKQVVQKCAIPVVQGLINRFRTIVKLAYFFVLRLSLENSNLVFSFKMSLEIWMRLGCGLICFIIQNLKYINPDSAGLKWPWESPYHPAWHSFQIFRFLEFLHKKSLLLFSCFCKIKWSQNNIRILGLKKFLDLGHIHISSNILDKIHRKVPAEFVVYLAIYDHFENISSLWKVSSQKWTLRK